MELGNQKWSKKKKVSHDLAKNRNVWKSFIRNRTTHASIENRD